jgi:hypothetical protein
MFKTMIVDQNLARDGVAAGYQYRGVVGVDYEGRKDPDFPENWNGKQAVDIIDEDENMTAIAAHSDFYYDSPRPTASSQKRIDKTRKRGKISKESRKNNRRKK